jgi:Glyoxalase-like domain
VRVTVVPSLPRLRQIALVARDLDETCARIEDELGVAAPFRDPGVAEFGLVNAVYEIGDTFLEVVSPAVEGTTAGRYLERRGGDAGYMALFQVADTERTRRRVAAMGLRTVWQIDLPDISGTHLHPQDVRGAIVSFDTPVVPASWRWGGPRWESGQPSDVRRAPRLAGVVVRVVDVDSAARTWAGVLDAPLAELGIRFEAAAGASDEGISEVELEDFAHTATICGVTFRPHFPG